MKKRRLVPICALLLLGAVVPSRAGMGNAAFWRSLLVPGWGQKHAGRDSAALRFFSAELVLWGGYFAFEKAGDVRKDEYRRYAAEHARARPRGKSDAFFDDLGFYDSRLQHDQFARYQDGPEADTYPDGPEFFWEWDRSDSRLHYRKLRNSSERAHRRALYATGLVVVNHLISAVHAARTVRGGSPSAVSAPALETVFDPGRAGFEVRLIRRFP